MSQLRRESAQIYSKIPAIAAFAVEFARTIQAAAAGGW
jgi:hypothetical protein